MNANVKPNYSKLKDAGIILVLYVILASDQTMYVFNRYLPNFGTDSNNKQLILGLFIRATILIILFLATKKYLIV